MGRSGPTYRGTLIIGAVFLVLAGYVYLFEIRGEARREAAEKERTSVWSLDKEMIDGVKLVFPLRTLSCRKDSTGAWRLIEPLETEGSTDDIERLLTSLEEARSERTVADSVWNASDFGLDVPQVTVSLHSERDGGWTSLSVGDENPTGRFRYAKRDNGRSVFLVSSSLFGALNRTVSDLRFRKVLDIDREHVTGLTLRRPEESVRGVKVLDGWHLEEPVRARADGDRIDAILRKIAGAEGKRFIDEGTENGTQYGFDRPEISLDLSVDSGSLPRQLIIGRREGDQYYARDLSRQPVFTVDSSLVSALRVTAADIRDRAVLTVNSLKVRAFSFRTDTLQVLLEKDSTDTWQILEPIRRRADEEVVRDLILDLENLKVETFVSDHPEDVTPFGLSRPRGRIEVRADGDTTAQVLLVGKEENGHVYVKNIVSPSVYRIDAAFLEKIGKDVNGFRDRTILHFLTFKVRGLEILTEFETVRWEKNSKGEWNDASGRRDEGGDVPDLLSGLQHLTVEAFVEDDPPDLARYGLAEPQATVTLRFNDAPPQILFIGMKQNGTVYVKKGDVESVYLADSDSANKIMMLFKNANDERTDERRVQ